MMDKKMDTNKDSQTENDMPMDATMLDKVLTEDERKNFVYHEAHYLRAIIRRLAGEVVKLNHVREAEAEWTNVYCRERDEAVERSGDHLELLARMKAERDELRRENKSLKEEIAIDDKLIETRNRILDALPCPVHGQCVPYVLEWIESRNDSQEG
jgi:hypothetical protein